MTTTTSDTADLDTRIRLRMAKNLPGTSIEQAAFTTCHDLRAEALAQGWSTGAADRLFTHAAELIAADIAECITDQLTARKDTP